MMHRPPAPLQVPAAFSPGLPESDFRLSVGRQRLTAEARRMEQIQS